jgi:hypothetical protein
MKKENIVGVSLFVVVLVVFGMWQSNKDKNKYKKSGVFTTGTVVEVKDDYKKRPYVHYVFNAGSKTYNNESPYPEFKSSIEADLINKKFLVIYLEDNPNESEMLISRAKFKRFGLSFPDSLSWTFRLEVP